MDSDVESEDRDPFGEKFTATDTFSLYVKSYNIHMKEIDGGLKSAKVRSGRCHQLMRIHEDMGRPRNITDSLFKTVLYERFLMKHIDDRSEQKLSVNTQ